jgi:hypothetical protein
MSPYKPDYLWQAAYEREKANRAYLDYVTECEDSGVLFFTQGINDKLDSLFIAYIKADERYASMWEKWQVEQNLFFQLAKINPELTIFEFYELGLNEKAEMHECNNPTFSQRNEQVQYSTEVLTYQVLDERN